MEVLRQHGLNYPGDYEFSVVGVHPARWKALQEGTIDAAVQLIPLNFVAEDAGYINLGEVSDYIPEIVFTAFIVDRAAAQRRREQIVEFLRGVIEGTRWVYDPANDESLLALTKELTQAEGKYGRQALDYMRDKKVFSPDLSIPDAAFAKSIELMQKAGLADDRLVANARKRARRQLSAGRAKARLERDKSTRWACCRLTSWSMQERRSASFAALFFLPHTIAKLRNIERASGLFDKVGFRPPRFFVLLTALLEVIAAFGLISGLYPRIGRHDRGRHSARRGLRHRPHA